MNAKRTSVTREILRLRRTLRALDGSLHRLAPLLTAFPHASETATVNGRSRPRLSLKARASMVLQGRYMGYMRQLKPRQKAQVRKIREARGVIAAIQAAQRLRA